MTIILFLIDTSSSMNQRTYLGARPTLLEVAKDAVEKFLKSRQRDPASRGDRYMLLSFEDPPSNVKAGWKESHSVFMNELKHLHASGVTNMGSALKNAFDLLNLNRMQSGIDMYGLGVQDELILPMQSNVPGSELTREPFRWDQRLFSLVLRLTGAPPMDNSPNTGITSMPIDHSPIGAMCAVTSGRSYAVTSQRSLIQSIDALVQKVQSGVVIQFEKIGPDPPPIEDIDVSSHNTNIQPSDHNTSNEPTNNHHSKQPHGLSSSNATPPSNGNSGLTSILPAPNTSPLNSVPPPVPSVPPVSSTFHHNHDQQQPIPPWYACRSMIYVQRSAQKGFAIGHWPIPEAFWCDQNLNSLPPRTAHPIVKFTCVNTEPHVMDSLPFDKYELEVSPLTQYILSRKQPHVAWQVHISNSGRNNELGQPFGYLKAATNMACVNLFVMPYNYPVLLPILEEVLKKPQPQHPSQHPNKQLRSEWRIAFDEYLKTMPPYYAGPLKRAMQRMGANASFASLDSIEANCMSYTVHGHLKRLKNIAKAEFEKLVASVSQPRPQNIDTVRVLQCGNSLKAQVECTSYVNMRCTGRPSSSFYYRYATMKNELNEFTNFTMRIRDGASMSSNENLRSMQSYRNPYDIDRKDLIDQIYWMRTNFLQAPSRVKYRDEDQIHSLPVAQMGNYQDYLKKQPMPLRELESTPVRQHMFGNPFKIDKKGMMVDEADIDLASASPKHKKVNPNQRRRGPLPKDFMVSNSYSWTKSPSASPNPHQDEQGVVAQTVVIQNGSLLDQNSSPQQILRPSTQDLEIRSEVFKLIRKPGLNYEPVLQQLSQLKGDKRKFLVEETITEAKKFKKSSLVATLIQFMTD